MTTKKLSGYRKRIDDLLRRLGRAGDGKWASTGQPTPDTDPQSTRHQTEWWQKHRPPHSRQDRVNRQADLDAPREVLSPDGPGVPPDSQGVHYLPPQRRYSPLYDDRVNTFRDRRLPTWDFLTTDQEVTRQGLYHFGASVSDSNDGFKFGDFVEGSSDVGASTQVFEGVYVHKTGKDMHLVFVGKDKAKPLGAVRLWNVKAKQGRAPILLRDAARAFANKALDAMRRLAPKTAEKLERELSAALETNIEDEHALSTPTKTLAESQSAPLTARHGWFVVTNKRGSPIVGTQIIHKLKDAELANTKSAKNPLVKYFHDDARPVWAPDFVHLGYAVVFPYSGVEALVKKLDDNKSDKGDKSTPAPKTEAPSEEPRPAFSPPTAKDKEGTAKSVPSASVVSADRLQPPKTRTAGEEKAAKDDLYVIPVEPVYSPLPMPSTTLKVDDWWAQMRNVPQTVSPYLAPGGVRVMGDSRRLSDLRKEFIAPGLKGPDQSVPGLGKRFGDSSNTKQGEQRDKKDVSEPQGNKTANDLPKVGTDGTKSTSTTPQAYKMQKSGDERLIPRASYDPEFAGDDLNGDADDAPATQHEEIMANNKPSNQPRENSEPVEATAVREIGNRVWRELGAQDWEFAHALHKAADRIAQRAAVAKFNSERGIE
jgi:hypothetical protein